MFFSSLKNWLYCAVAVFLAAALFSSYLLLRSHGNVRTLDENWDQILAVAVLVGGSILTVLWLVRFARRQWLRAVAERIQHYQQSPTSRGDFHVPHSNSTDAAGQLFQKALNDLCAGYHKALSERVLQNEALESMRGLVGKAENLKESLPHTSVRSTTSRDMVARLTPTMHWLTATPSLLKYLGCANNEINGRPFNELVNPKDRQKLSDAFQLAVRTGVAQDVDLRLHAGRPKQNKSADGTPHDGAAVRHVRVDMLSRYSELGVPLHVRFYIVDISAQVRIEEELQKKTQQLAQTNKDLNRRERDLKLLKEIYRDVYHNAPVMYFSLDASGRLTSFNETMAQRLGYERKELLNTPYARLLTPDGRKRFPKDRKKYESEAEFETQWVRKDGALIDVCIRNTILRGDNGKLAKLRGVAQDVTERNRLAEELRRRDAAVESAVANRDRKESKPSPKAKKRTRSSKQTVIPRRRGPTQLPGAVAAEKSVRPTPAPQDTAISSGKTKPDDCLVNPASILLVEDMQEIALLVQRLAGQAGHRVSWVKSGEEAWRFLRETQKRLPDLVLLNINLPGISGVDLCKKIRRRKSLAQLRIALFSQLERKDAVAACRDGGADFVVSKELLCQARSWHKQIGRILSQ